MRLETRHATEREHLNRYRAKTPGFEGSAIDKWGQLRVNVLGLLVAIKRSFRLPRSRGRS